MSGKSLAKVLLILCASLLATNTASAQLLKTGKSVFNYNLIDGAYVDGDGADGLRLRFSADIRENFALNAGYTRLSVGRFDADTVAAGLTYHIEAAKFPGKADWNFGLGFQIIDAEGSDETGLSADAGIRYAVTEQLEANAALLFTTAIDTDLSLGLRGLYELATGFSAFVETVIGDGTEIGLGLRFYWR